MAIITHTIEEVERLASFTGVVYSSPEVCIFFTMIFGPFSQYLILIRFKTFSEKYLELNLFSWLAHFCLKTSDLTMLNLMKVWDGSHGMTFKLHFSDRIVSLVVDEAGQ